jgi:ABC-type transporter Mla MlaB component
MDLVAMLKITLHDHRNQLRFRLEGKLAGAWVSELRQCWQTAASTTQDRSISIDLSEVDFVDAEGLALLADMVRHGVHLKAVTPFIRSLVAEIERAARYARVEEPPSRRSDVLVSSDPSTRNPGAL